MAHSLEKAYAFDSALLEMIEDEISQTFVIAQEVNDNFCGFDYLYVEQS